VEGPPAYASCSGAGLRQKEGQKQGQKQGSERGVGGGQMAPAHHAGAEPAVGPMKVRARAPAMVLGGRKP